MRFSDDSFWEEVERDSERRLADPLPFALEVIEELFREESDKERGFALWLKKLRQGIWWGDDAIRCLEKVLADPPPNLGALMAEHGLHVWIQTPTGEVQGDDQARVDWLRATAIRMRAMFEDYVAQRTAEMKAEHDDQA